MMIRCILLIACVVASSGLHMHSLQHFRHHTQAQVQECRRQLDALIASGPTSTTAPEAHRLVQDRLNAWHAQHQSNITEGHSGQVPLQQAWYLALAAIPCVHTVCEIGFNAGHSASVWMAARDDIHLVSFDLGAHPYAFTALEFYATNYPGRITTTLGDSLKTVPRVAVMLGRMCDILVVDGFHTYDNAILGQRSQPIFMDDVNCQAAGYCTGPDRAIQEAASDNIIQVWRAVTMNATGHQLPEGQEAVGVRGFSVGQYII